MKNQKMLFALRNTEANAQQMLRMKAKSVIDEGPGVVNGNHAEAKTLNQN